MKIQVKLFALARQEAGAESVEVELPPQATVADLRQALARRIPALASRMGQMMFAVDAAYADDRAVLSPQCEVACIPPVSGG